jgi:hypothetical protein
MYCLLQLGRWDRGSKGCIPAQKEPWMRTGPPSEEYYQTSRNKIINLKWKGSGGGGETVTDILIRPIYYTEMYRSAVSTSEYGK